MKEREVLNELALFAGAGGGILGGLLHGWRTVAAVEIEDYPRRVLLQRQADGILPKFPIWDDVCTFDGKPWRGKIDVISGGFPCQDISAAGKGAGIEGARSGLWGEMARIICEVGPRYVFVENSPMLTTRGLGVVLGGLAKMGYNARWGVFSSGDFGAQHRRERLWIVAHSMRIRLEENANDGQIRKSGNTVFRNLCSQAMQMRNTKTSSFTYGCGERDELANRVDRLKAIGNGQDPRVAAAAWDVLK
jgi:DNA (cytosine-5)-methyltransferase 1